MKNSLFKKLFLTYGLTIVIGFGILALMLLRLFDNYFIESKKQLLLEQGRQITEEVALGLFTGQFDQSSLEEDLQILDKFLNAHIWIVDAKGTIYGVSGKTEEGVLGKQIDSDRLEILSKGERLYERGNFHGMLKEQSMSVGYPIFYLGSFRGGVLVHASLPEVQKNFRGIYKLTIWAIVISGLLAYGILYFQIKRISTPLKEINEAARVIAGGQFQKRLDIATGDEIEELAQSFNHMAESLEKIEENRRNLIANISHDLRSPMTSIRGFIEGMLDGTIPEDKQKHYLEIVLAESKRLIKITNELLELGNMQQGKVEVKKSVFELNEVLRRKLIAYEQSMTAKKMKVTLTLCDEKTMVRQDAVLLERIISNLLDNAVKFTPECGEIALKTLDKGDRFWIEIKNTGIAIKQEELNKIWDRFHKGDASRGEFKGGFGLGLSIVREIVAILEEKIWVESAENGPNYSDKYVAFTFTIEKA